MSKLGRAEAGGEAPLDAVSDAERAALEKERLEMALEAGRMGAWEWEIATGRVNWSPSLERLHGLEPGTFAGTYEAFQADIHPDDQSLVDRAIRDCLESCQEHRIEYRIVTPTGDVRWLSARGRLLVDAAGSPARMMGVCSDVTEMRQEILRRDFLLAATQVLATGLDYEGTLRKVTQMAVSGLADWCAVDLVDGEGLERVAIAHADPERLHLAEALHREYPPGKGDPCGPWAVIRTGKPEFVGSVEEAELRGWGVDARQSELLQALGLRAYFIVPIPGDGGVIGAVTVVNADSRRSFGELDLRVAEALASSAGIAIEKARLYRQAKGAVESREELMAMVSHDLRNALSVMVLRATTLESRLGNRTNVEPKVLEDVEGLRTAARRMDRMVLDLVDGAAIDGGGLQLVPATEDLAALIADALPGLQILAQRSGQRLDLDAEGLEGLRIECDAERLTQALENLVANAAKFGPEGGRITLGIRRGPEGVEISVADQGPGVPEGDRERIFHRFVKTADGRGGLGLGLYIVEAIVRGHGGRIWVEDAPGAGAAFRLVLPEPTLRS